VLHDVFPLTPIIIVPIIVALEQVVEPPILNPPKQFALVITLEHFQLVLVRFVLIVPVLWMRNVLSRFLHRDVSHNSTTVILIVIMVIVLFRTPLHFSLRADVITAKLQIIVANLVEMRIASIKNTVCIQSTTIVYIVFPLMTQPQIVLPVVVMVIVYLPILLLTLLLARVMVLSGLDIVPYNVVLNLVNQIKQVLV